MKNGRDRLFPTLRQSGRKAAGFFSALAVLAFAAALAGCGGGGAGAFPEFSESAGQPEPAPGVQTAPRQLPDQQRRQVAAALDTDAFRSAVGGASPDDLPGMSHDPRILDANPFADDDQSGPAAGAAARAVRLSDGYKAFDFFFPATGALMTVAVWVSEDQNGAPLARLQIYISPDALLIVAVIGIPTPSEDDEVPIAVRPPKDENPDPPDPPETPDPPDPPKTPETPDPPPGETAGPLCPSGSLSQDGKPISELTERLREAARQGDAERACEWLRRGAEIDDTQNGAEESILHDAVRNGHLNVVTLLLANGAAVNPRKEGQGPSPLDVAAKKENAEIAAALREAGGKCFWEEGPLCDGPSSPPPPVAVAPTLTLTPPTPTLTLTPPITTAPPVSEIPDVCLYGDGGHVRDGKGGVAVVPMECARYCPAGPMPQARTWPVFGVFPQYPPPLLIAPLSSQERLNQELFFAVMNTNERNWGVQRRAEICRWLLRGAEINSLDPFLGRTVLHEAAASGGGHAWELAEFLIANGADVGAKDKRGREVLHWTAHACIGPGLVAYRVASYDAGIVEKLMKAGADINARDENGQTPLHYAAKDGIVAMADLLVRSGANLGIEENTGKTPLELATAAYWNSERNIYVLEVFTHLRDRLRNLEAVMALLREAERTQAPAVAASRQSATGDGSDLVSRFGRSFAAGGAFGDLFGGASGGGVSHLSRLNSLMRAGAFSGEVSWDWERGSDRMRLWFSDGSRGDLGFGAGGVSGWLGDGLVRSPFAGLSGSGLVAGGEADLRGYGKFRVAAFGAYERRGLFGDETDSRWADWASRGLGVGGALETAEGLSSLADGGWRARGALTEVHFSGELGELALQAGGVGETDSWLSGESRGGDLPGLRSRTAFAGVSGLAELADGWRLRGSAHWGRSWALSDGVLRRGGSWASSYAAGLERGDWLYSGDGFVLRFSQPLRVERWDLELAGEGGLSGFRGSGSGPSGRQLDVDAAYRLPLSGGGWLLLSAGVRSESAHVESSGLAGAAFFSLEREF